MSSSKEILTFVTVKYAFCMQMSIPARRLNPPYNELSTLYNELREETDYQKQIQRYRDNNCDYTLNMKMILVIFTAGSSKAMLS